LKEKITEIKEILNGIQEARNQQSIEPHSGELPVVDFENGQNETSGDSITIKYRRRISSTQNLSYNFSFSSSGSKVDTINVLPSDTIGNQYKGQDILKAWKKR